MKNALRWLSILAIFILAACNPPEPGGDLEQLPQQVEIADVPELGLPPPEPVFMHAILLPQPGEVIQQSPYTLIYIGNAWDCEFRLRCGVKHFEVWVDGSLVDTSPVLGRNSGGPSYNHFYYSEYEWTPPASQGDHTIAVRAVGDGVNNFSEFMEVEVTVDILPSQALDTDPDRPQLSMLPDCTPAELEPPDLITPEHYTTLSRVTGYSPGLLQWANTAGCFPDEYTLLVSFDPIFSSNPYNLLSILTTEGFITVWPPEGYVDPIVLVSGRQHFWTVFASADGVDGPSAPVRSFFVGPLCDSFPDLFGPYLHHPTMNEVVDTPHVLLSWMNNPSCLPDGYRIELQTNPEFSASVRSTILASPETSWLTPELEDCTTYYWRVAALEDGVPGDFSRVYAFSTDFGSACAAPAAEAWPWAVALIDQACYLGPDPANYPIAGYLLEDETALIAAQDLSSEWWAIENPDADGFCFVRKDDNEVSGETSGLPTWRNPDTSETVCTSSLDQTACQAAGGTWVEPLSSAPYCSCP